jgi:NADH:ubiquinone oxidoreductase subunit F (NADH-binding)
VIPITGIYKILFSAQCDVIASQHYLEIFPVINNVSVPRSNTRIRLSASVENCLTVEYFLSFTANDVLQFYMTGDSTNSRIVAITEGGGTPVIPDIPSIIVTIMQIA